MDQTISLNLSLSFLEAISNHDKNSRSNPLLSSHSLNYLVVASQTISDMLSLPWALVAAVAPAIVHAATLTDICTAARVQEALPASGFIPGITIDASSVETTLVGNASVRSEWYPASTIEYCNVTFAYSHDGLAGDRVHVTYWAPAPGSFLNRYVSTGGGGLAINSQSQSIPTGVIVGAVSGITDGGFGSFNTQWDAVFLAANGTVNWQSVYMFGYQAHHELATLGKEFAKNLYGVADGQKIYSYYQGCSEGGREGWSQDQRFADQFDGLAIGAPALRYGQQQVNHLAANVMEQTHSYFPPSCELEKILNLTIAACDPLDGRTDGVVARSDLCKNAFDFNSTVGQPYSCDAKLGGSGPGGFGGLGRRQILTSPAPAQNGTVTAEAAALVAEYYDGLHDSEGRRIYLGYQPGSAFTDAAASFDEATQSWVLSISGLGGEWVARFLQLRDARTLESLDGVTADTLRDWMQLGMDRYADSLQTTHPDLGGVRAAGGKILHVHGEQDDSVPAASSVRYYESVRAVMFPGRGLEESAAALDDFYRLYLVPGGAHCGSNANQPGGGWPQTTLQTVIEWVEKGVAPDTLNNTGAGIGALCRWPRRPLWSNNGADFACVYDRDSIDSWMYTFDAFKMPIY
ncbi:tannase and feruloyl esterase-domain-containing protein [Colletotrichum cereale]|nr:tannase and feruloyl esterase-domain-containing protein [Colletotrichum cereale]